MIRQIIYGCRACAIRGNRSSAYQMSAFSPNLQQVCFRLLPVLLKIDRKRRPAGPHLSLLVAVSRLEDIPGRILHVAPAELVQFADGPVLCVDQCGIRFSATHVFPDRWARGQSCHKGPISRRHVVP